MANTQAHPFPRPVAELVLVLVGLFMVIWRLPAIPLLQTDIMPLWLHTAAETFSIVVAMLIFGVSWNAFSNDRPGNVVIMGCAFLAVGLLDFAHMLSFPGMPDFVTPSSTEKGINFWLAARMLAALTLQGVAIRSWSRPLRGRHSRFGLLFGSLAVSSLIFWAGLFHPQSWPRTFIEGQGLTGFKVGCEYLICIILVIPTVRFYHLTKRRRFEGAEWLFVASAVTILSELCFTFYSQATDLFNLLGHVYKIVAYGCIYRAIFVASVREPFHHLRAATDQLGESQRLLQTIVDNVPIRIFWKDKEARFLGANKAFLHDAGLDDVGQLIGNDDYRFFPEHAARYRRDDFAVMASAQAKLNFEEPIRSADGNAGWLLTSKVPLTDADGRVTGVLGTFADITELKQIQESLKGSESKFRAIIDKGTSKNAAFRRRSIIF